MECGGCQIQHIKQENQISTKIQWFFETLKRVGKWDSEHIAAAEKRISLVYLKTDHYRRRIRLHFDGKNLGILTSYFMKSIVIILLLLIPATLHGLS